MFTTQNKRKATTIEHRSDKSGEQLERFGYIAGNNRFPDCRYAIIFVGLAPELFIKQLKLMARCQDRLRPAPRSPAVTDRRFDAERYNDGFCRVRCVAVFAQWIKKTLVCRQVIER